MFAYLLCAIAKFCSNESGFEAIEIPAFARMLGTFCHKKTGQTPMSVRLGMVQACADPADSVALVEHRVRLLSVDC
jgi:hypothetical protein